MPQQVPAKAISSGTAATMEPTEDLRLAARTVAEAVDRETWPDFIDLIRRPAPQIDKHDAESLQATSRIPSFHVSDDLFRPIPDEILQHLDNTQSSSFMGLLMDLQRAWIAIDNKLFLWNYMTGNDYTTWEDQEQLISTVGLVSPRKNIFIKEIEYLLVIATSIEILLVGVAFSGSQKELKLYRTGYSVSTDDVRITNVIGTVEGRIFLCGANGHVYELIYQAQEGFLTRRCWKVDRSSTFTSYFVPTFLQGSQEAPLRAVATDEWSKVLYTLTGNSIITVYTYGPDLQSFQKLQTLTSLYSETIQTMDTLGMSHFHFDANSFCIVSLNVLKPTESNQLCLMAVTYTGLRLYFSRSGDVSVATATSPSYSISIRTVRSWVPPTGVNSSAPPSAGPNVHMSLYNTGVLIAANAAEETDILVGISPEAAVIGRTGSVAYSETSTDCQIRGRVWTLAEVPSPFTEITRTTFQALGIDSPLNELTTQTALPPRKFVALTNSGAYTITKRRPIDILEMHLQSYNYNAKELAAFAKSYGPDQICAMCLHLITRGSDSAIMNGGQLQGYLMLAERTYFEQGGKATMRANTTNVFEGGRMGVALAVPEVAYSGKHNGLVLALGRSIRGIWRTRIVKTLPRVAGKAQYGCNFDEQELTNVFTILQRLDAFLARNFDQIIRVAVNHGFVPLPSRADDPDDAEAQQKEAESLTRIHSLIRACLENIQFISLMMPSFTLLVASLPEARQRELAELNFEALATTPKGVSIARELIAASVNKEVDLGRDVEEITRSLEQKCPSLCSSTEVLQFKGLEALHKAKSATGEIQKSNLTYSLQLFINAVIALKYAHVEEICRSYIALGFTSGAVKLALAYAQLQDGSALQKALTSCSVPQGAQLSDREQAYRLILDLIFAPQSSDVSIRTELVMALKTSDLLFHHYVYETLFAESKTQLLLDIRPPELVDYLYKDFQENLNKPGFNVAKADLLVRVFAVLNAFEQAAQILSSIGESETPMEIRQRLNYFTKAMNFLNSSPTSTQHILAMKSQVQTAIDVAEIQGEVLQALSLISVDDPRASSALGKVIHEVQYKLLSLDELYQQCVIPFGLHNEALIIFHAAGHRDMQMVRKTWRAVIDSAGPPTSQATYERLSTTISAVGRRLMPDEFTFPLGFLISTLEELNYQNRQVAPHGWVIRSLIGAEVSYRVLYQQYYELYDSRVYPWSSGDTIQFLLSEFSMVLDLWIRAIERRSDKREDLPAAELDQLIARISVTPQLPRELHDRFSAIRKRLYELFQ
ncbi:hypothetical protein SeMB42_g04428 [Synchytrium endobioticum]|nr:hypothetical protein SeMB42_g04428 [Synchytrium endobioticum]